VTVTETQLLGFQVDKSALQRILHQRRHVMQIEFSHDIGAVRVYRFFAKAQHIGDLLVRMALRYKFQDSDSREVRAEPEFLCSVDLVLRT